MKSESWCHTAHCTARALAVHPGWRGKGSGEAEFTARSCFCYLGDRRETHTCRKMLQVKGTLPSWESDVSFQRRSSWGDFMSRYECHLSPHPSGQSLTGYFHFFRSSGRVNFLKKSHWNGVCSIFAQKHTPVPVPQVMQYQTPHPRLTRNRHSILLPLKEMGLLAAWSEWIPHTTLAKGCPVPSHSSRAQCAFICSLI